MGYRNRNAEVLGGGVHGWGLCVRLASQGGLSEKVVFELRMVGEGSARGSSRRKARTKRHEVRID